LLGGSKVRILRAFTILILFTVNLFAQDTLEVAWSFDGLHPAINNLFEVIKADSNRPVDRIYKLEKGGHYLLDSAITFNFHLNVVGEKPGQTLESAPAIIQLTNDSLSNTQNKMVTGNGSITLKNLWLTGSDTTGDQTNYQPIELNGQNKEYLIENCVFTQSNYALIAFTGAGNSIHFKDNVFRNLIGKPSEQQWQGRGISIWADQESVIIENNTFFNVGMTAFQFEGGAPDFLLMVHNTIVNTGWSVIQGLWWREAYFVNNLIINGFWYGITPTMRNDINFEEGEYGLFNIDNLPSAYGPEEGRRIKISNNVAWNDNTFDNYYADSISSIPFIGSIINKDFVNEYPQMQVFDTIWADPGLNTVFIESQYDKMVQNILTLRQGITPAPDYFWMLPEDEDGSVCYTCINWPLPEDFAYESDLTVYSTDVLAVGDLNWYPDDKETWENNREDFINEILRIYPDPHPRIYWQSEAEDGTIQSDASVDTVDGTLSFLMDAGYIKWEFDLEVAGQYDLDVLIDLNNRSSSGVNFFVNDNEIHDPRAWGQYVFGNDDDSIYPEFPASGLNWWRIKQEETIEFTRDGSEFLNLPEGQNSIEIRASWCNNFFGGINILEAGTENAVKMLDALDVTEYSFAEEYTGYETAPSNFRTVVLGENGGTVSWQTQIPETGYYSLFLVSKAYEESQQAQINVNRQQAISDFQIPERESFRAAISEGFLLTAGENTVSLTSQNIEIDYVYLALVKIVIGIDNETNPQNFHLSQNYPNPFNPETVISYQLSMNSVVKLTVYDIMGREIETLVNQKQSPGVYSVNFNAQHLASGIYFYRLEIEDFIQQKKMLLIK